MLIAWVSLFGVALTDLYIRLVANDVIRDLQDLLMADHESHQYDVVVVGAGGAGLRAAIEASAQGARTALVCKSLLGKAHTVMAEGGIAAALGNVYPEDDWRVHFRDTLRGGKFLNNWRMVQIQAQEAPDRVLELEEWGALFDRTEDGRILQRDFGGHRYARLAHVGDRTGLEMIRTLQNHAVHKGIDVFMECTVTRLLKDGDRIAGAFAYWRESGRFVVFEAPAVVLATGGIGKAYKITSNSWEYTGDGHALRALGRRRPHRHGVRPVPPDRDGVAAVGPRDPRDRGCARRRRRPPERRRRTVHVPLHPRACSGPRRPTPRRRPTAGTPTRRTPGARPTCCLGTRWPGRSTARSRRAGASPHGGVFLDIATRRDAEYIQRRLPSMYHQFRQLADVDITSGADGGRADLPLHDGRRSGRRRDPGVDRAWAVRRRRGGRGSARRQPARRQLAVRSRSSSAGAPACTRPSTPGRSDRPAGRRCRRRSTSLAREAVAPFEASGGENPYAIQQDLQECMHALVGIIRTEDELTKALEELAVLRDRAARVRVEGHRQYNPGWHLALDLGPLLAVSECVTRAALERRESRGAQTRDDYPDDRSRPRQGQRRRPPARRRV